MSNDIVDRPRRLQLFLLRVYVGLDFIHHFAEKFGLLGPLAYRRVLDYFSTVGPHPTLMVALAGLCEFGAFVGFTFGLLTRVAAVGTFLYLVITMVVGHHVSFGFTWNNPGGGWEYPAFWAAVCLSFVLTGGGRWSLDHVLMPRVSAWSKRPSHWAPSSTTSTSSAR